MRSMFASFPVVALATVIAVQAQAQIEQAVVIPAPAVDVKPPTSGTATAVFAGGCFWGVQGVYQHVDGVLKAVSGYAGGSAQNAKYDLVGNGDTGHAESVQIIYDPAKITYGQLLHIFFSVVHDPTQLNMQGPDHGPQYRTAIFTSDSDQRAIAEKYIAQLNAAKVYPKRIVTTLENAPFHPAEAYHQDFLERNPSYPYIVYYDLPKVRDLARVFPAVYRADPVLVTPRVNPRRAGPLGAQ